MAVTLRAIQRELGRDEFGPLSANALYIQPVIDGPLEIDVNVLRNGRGAAQATADLRSDLRDRLGIARDRGVRHACGCSGPVHGCHLTPTCPRPMGCPIRLRPGLTTHHSQTSTSTTKPTGGRHRGGIPTRGRRVRPSTCWTRLLKEPDMADGTISATRCPMPRRHVGRGRPGRRQGPSSFFVLTLELSLHWFATTMSPWVLQHVVSPHAGDGYASGHVYLWDENRTLLGFASQRARPCAPRSRRRPRVFRSNTRDDPSADAPDGPPGTPDDSPDGPPGAPGDSPGGRAVSLPPSPPPDWKGPMSLPT